MGLVACAECGNKISDSAKACPQCGAKVKRTSLLTKIFAVIFGFAILSAILGGNGGSTGDATTPPPEITAEKKAENARVINTIATGAAVVQSLRNPDSVKWTSIRADTDGTTVCFEYRAQNGFGGMNQEHVSYVKGTPSQDVATWNKHCTRELFDMAYTADAIQRAASR